MEIEQLELDLWDSLETAVKFPQTANLHQLCDALEQEVAMQPVEIEMVRDLNPFRFLQRC